LKAWISAHAYAVRGAWARLRRRPFAALFESVLLGLVLALPLAFGLLVENVRSTAARHPASPELSVFMALDAVPADVKRVASDLGAIAGASVRFVPKSQALARLRQSPALAEVLEALGENPLPDAFVVRLRDADAGRLERTRTQIGAWPAIARVQVDSQWARQVDGLGRTLRAAALALGLVLALATGGVVFNTVRLQMLQQREELELSRLVGATDAFLRRPYLYFGLFQGTLAALVAIAFLVAAQAWAANEIDALSAAYGFPWGLEPVPPEALVGVLVFGAALGLGAAWCCAERHLWARQLRR